MNKFIQAISRIFRDNNNKIIVIKDGKEYVNNWLKMPKGLRIKFKGSNNTVRIELPCNFRKSKIKVRSSNSLIEIKRGCSFSGLHLNCGLGKHICKIGNNVSTTGSLNITMWGTSQLIIEDDCMFALRVLIRTSDSHLIFDKDSRQVINKQKSPLIIGHHSWVGQDVFITKNASIPPNSIIGMASVVSKRFTEEYTCIAGNPARVVKQNVYWTGEMDT
ncbi:MAG: hypothetical protein LBK53_09315 [Heliobacteriaceae bacterium]|jgi:acetyltransferase-like isoleucine patch superfamily enzyme|nr:hypothetical protein [Heliobacteriaceae bacterium]